MVAPAGAGAGQSLPHRFKLVIWASGFVLSCLVLVGLWLFWPKETPLLVWTITDYHESLPLNSWARDDAESLSAAATKNLRTTVLDSNKTGSDSFRTAIRQQLDSVSPGGPGTGLLPGRVALIYLSGHGVTDEQNDPCLQLMDSATDAPTTIRLQDLFDDICQHKSLQKPGTRVVLLLDASRVHSDWRHGVLYNNFNDRLSALIQQGRWPGLIVFNSASPGQVGWAAPELGGSVFGHFVQLGLQGQADTDATRGYVTLGELRDYLLSRVDGWVWRHRGERQTPQQLGGSESDKLYLVHVAPKSNSDAAAEVARPSSIDRERLDRVLGLWRRIDSAQPNQPGGARGVLIRHHPLARASAARRLLRLEAMLLGGQAYRDDDFDREEPVARQLVEQLEGFSLAAELNIGTLPLRRLAGLPETLADVNGFSAWRKAREKVPPEPFTFSSAISAGAVVSDIWSQLAADDAQPQFDDLDRAVEFLTASRPSLQGSPDRFIEMHFLRMLQTYADRRPHVAAALGLALRARDHAEHAAAPQDERTHYAVWSGCNQADQKRREAEDLLLIGSDTDVEQAEKLWRDLLQNAPQHESYAALHKTHETLSTALELRDRIWSELPDLTHWLLEQHRRSLTYGTSPSTSSLPPLETLDQSIVKVRELSAVIEDATFGRRPTEAVETLRKRCDDDWQRLRQAWNQRVEQLKDRQAAQGGHTVRDILACVGTSLLAADDRAELYDRLGEAWIETSSSADSFDEELPTLGEADSAFVQLLGSRPATPAAADRTAAPSSGAGEGSGSDRAGQLTNVEHRHPALVICDVNFPWPDRTAAPSRAQFIDQFAKQGRELRSQLENAARQWKDLQPNTQALLRITPPRTPLAVRADLSRADIQSRAMAGIIGSAADDRLGSSPSQVLRNLDWYFLSLWHAQRAIEEFWGPRREGGEPYFADAARGYLENVSTLGWGPAASRQLENQDLNTLLERRVQIAKSIGKITVTGTLMLHRGAPSENVTVETTPDPQLPTGMASLFLHEPGDLKSIKPAHQAPSKNLPTGDGNRPIRRRSVSSSANPDRWELSVRSDEVPTGMEQLAITLLYRGHILTQAVGVRESSPEDKWEWSRPQYPPPRITVSGDALPIETLIVILDCSGTMRAAMPGGSRWEVARDTLIKTLRDRPDGLRKIGLLVYGSQWKNEAINPNEDLEWLRKPARFDAQAVQEIQKSLEELSPTEGFTPISKALREAFKEFKPSERSAIVLITDGNEEWYQPAPGEIAASQQRALADRALKLAPINIVMVGGEKPDDFVKQVAHASSGELVEVQDARSLSQALLKSFEGPPFVIRPIRDGGIGVSRPIKLGESWKHSSWSTGQAGQYEVALSGRGHDARELVTLEGGEWLKLKYDLARRQLTFEHFNQDERPPGSELLDPRNPQREFVVMPHLPPPEERRGEQVSFWVSVQARQARANDSWLFSPRPKCIWAEVRPRRPADQLAPRPTYYFFEPIFVPDLSVPVMRFDVPRWRKDTEDAPDAEVQLWFHPEQDVPPNMTLSMDRDQQEFQRTDLEPQEIRGVNRLRLEKHKASSTQPLTFVVSEEHAAEETFVPLRLQMSPEPDRIERAFLPDRKRATTTFIYRNPNALDDQRAELKITTREKIKASCMGLGEPLQVRVPERP